MMDASLNGHGTGGDRVAAIEALFRARGWHLRFREADGAWEAWYYLAGADTPLPASVLAASRVEAAEAALALYEQRP